MVKPGIPLGSRLVSAKVDHERLRQGQRHSFRYKVFYGLIDVDELPLLSARLWTFSDRGHSIYSLGVKDFINFGKTDIKSNIASWLAEQGHSDPIDRLWVFAHLRTLGFNFNPLSAFFVESSGQTLCLVEVDNTFGEAKLYLLGALGPQGSLVKRIAKDYYVSPFIEHDSDFIFDIKRQNDNLKVQVTTMRGREPVLVARMHGRLQPMTDGRLLAYFLRMPMTPIKVLLAIHWQALRLLLKKVPFFRKKDFPELQRDYYANKSFHEHVT